MNRGLGKAIVASFSDDNTDVVRARFAPFEERDWQRCTQWLHTSGLALYFFDRLRTLGLQDVIPDKTFDHLKESCAQNRVRTEDLFNEFVEINMELQRAKLCYANLKGFTLSPRSCPNPALRYQHDLDFLVARRDAEECRRVLERQGYRLFAVFGDTWEFRAGASEPGSLRKLYKVRSQRSLELHLVPDTEQGESDRQAGQLSRLQLQVWNGFEFPALSERDKLLTQALHLFKHFQTEWTRTAWLLEYANAIRSHLDDTTFWRETVAAIEAEPEKKIGIGVSSLLVSRAFGVAPPAPFRSATVDVLPERVRLWACHYEDEVVFIEFPGSKLYLLLQDVLMANQPDWPSQRRKKLLPSRLPTTAIVAERSDDFWQQTQTTYTRLCFVWARLRFHVAAGLRYKIEAMRWKKFVAGFQA
ncbi:MAG TPA: nucleotidyltransferase family protein [Acidobacteriaceae bacterium]